MGKKYKDQRGIYRYLIGFFFFWGTMVISKYLIQDVVAFFAGGDLDETVEVLGGLLDQDVLAVGIVSLSAQVYYLWVGGGEGWVVLVVGQFLVGWEVDKERLGVVFIRILFMMVLVFKMLYFLEGLEVVCLMVYVVLSVAGRLIIIRIYKNRMGRNIVKQQQCVAWQFSIILSRW